MDVRHCLMALPGVTREDLRRVQSHPQALSQCDNYLRNMKGVVREAVSDTAGAAQAIAQQGLRWATGNAAVANTAQSSIHACWPVMTKMVLLRGHCPRCSLPIACSAAAVHKSVSVTPPCEKVALSTQGCGSHCE